MPKVKFRAGKSPSLVKCGEYLERDGRQLAFDSLNVVERDGATDHVIVAASVDRFIPSARMTPTPPLRR